MSYNDPNANYASQDDYTAHPEGGTAVAEFDPNDFELPAVASTSKTDDEIVKENAYPDVPPGMQRMVVTGFSRPEVKYFTVMVNGQEQSYQAYATNVRLGLASNPRAQIQEYLVMPPSDPAQVIAYLEGQERGKPDANKGWSAQKFYHFVHRIGFDFEPGQPLPAVARNLGNWIGKEVIADIKAGVGSRTVEKGPHAGKVFENRAQAKLFRYQRVTTGAGGVPLGAFRPPVHPGAPAAPAAYAPPVASGFPTAAYTHAPVQPQAAPVDRRAAVGLDNV